MLNKQKTKMMWCKYKGVVPKEYWNKKLIRCPECNKRMMVQKKYLERATQQDVTYYISSHKKKIKC